MRGLVMTVIAAALSGCAVVDTTATVVDAGAHVAGTAVGLTADAVGAAADAVTPSSADKKKPDDEHNH